MSDEVGTETGSDSGHEVPSGGSVQEPDGTIRQDAARRYWRANLRLMSILLSIWFVVPFGLGIVFVEPLNQIHVAGFPLGFWFAQQGSIYVFIVLVLIYAFIMKRIDRDHGVE
jgi:putative solute:sodium symporter small subunit